MVVKAERKPRYGLRLKFDNHIRNISRPKSNAHLVFALAVDLQSSQLLHNCKIPKQDANKFSSASGNTYRS